MFTSCSYLNMFSRTRKQEWLVYILYLNLTMRQKFILYYIMREAGVGTQFTQVFSNIAVWKTSIQTHEIR